MTDANAMSPDIFDKGRFALDSSSRAIEQWLPVGEDTKEFMRKKRVIRNCVFSLSVLFLASWAVLGLYAVVMLVKPTDYSVAPAGAGDISKEMDAMNNNVAQDVLRGARSAENSQDDSAFTLHGPLGMMLPVGWSRSALNDLSVPLDRRPIDNRDRSCKGKNYGSELPSTSVVIIFCNEPFETLMRSVHSVLNMSPPNILKEIVLVDDGSTEDYIKSRSDGGTGLLEDYLQALPRKIKLVRQGRRSGIVQARLAGINAAEGEAFVILDSHVECQPGWLEPLVYPLAMDKSTVVMPHIDGIDKNTYALQKGGVGCTLGLIWKVMEHAFSPDSSSPTDRLNAKTHQYVTSPTMAGGLFAANKEYFLSIGGYDQDMTGWGAENVELSLRLWQCGGKLICTECSRVYHMFGGGKYYTTGSHSTTANRMRTMAVWMDDYADVACKPLELRKNLQCKSFQWYLDNVWPESELRKLPDDLPYMGPLRSVAGDMCLPRVSRGTSAPKLTSCTEKSPAFSLWRREKRISPAYDDETCLLSTNKWDWCAYKSILSFDVKEVQNQAMAIQEAKKSPGSDSLASLYNSYGDFVAVTIQDPHSGRCLSVVRKSGKPVTEFVKCTKDYDPEQVRPEAPTTQWNPSFKHCMLWSLQTWLWSRYMINPFWSTLHQ